MDPSQDRPVEQGGVVDRLAAVLPRMDGSLYAGLVVACIAWGASSFYHSMLTQTGGTWSAPLDDVFIHFDYARATARGYPFQWSEGNGFSSGNTSLTYPFVLAFGYWALALRDVALMKWAAIVACASVAAFLLIVGRLADDATATRSAKYFVPPVVLSLGALNWSLWSGMENAFHLGVWALALAAWRGAQVEVGRSAVSGTRRQWLAGAACALLVLTRPESVVCVAVLALEAAWRRWRVGASPARSAAVAVALRIGGPGAAALLAQAVANRVFTGEWAAAGAIAKLALNNPYMTAGEKWDEYLHFLKYVVLRNTQHHFSDALPWGWLVPLLALVPLASRTTRALAASLWAQVVGWLLIVSLNGQVRWQNERYTMAAVTWLLVLAALGVAALVRPPRSEHGGVPAGRPRLVWAARAAAAVAAVALYGAHQVANFRDQVWFFGRASRNILDQHVTAGRVLARLGPRRVLVGDAGALVYASDRPGLDIIGLGGYHALPFARAGVHGLGASLELVERMPRGDRPDVMAIYPSWWGELPDLFGRRIGAVPVRGNVICGGAEKVLYEANWSPLDAAGRPRTLRPGERVVDELDVADLVSETEHGYRFPRPSAGFVGFRVLPDPGDAHRDLFDAGRQIPAQREERARLTLPAGPARLVVRTVASARARVEVRVQGRPPLGTLDLARSDGWIERSIDLPGDLTGPVDLSLFAVEGDWTDYHLWIVAR